LWHSGAGWALMVRRGEEFVRADSLFLVFNARMLVRKIQHHDSTRS
jgi:hypothetical protein